MWLAREELGLNPDDLGSPWRAAGASFVAFRGRAPRLPLIPFLAGSRGACAAHRDRGRGPRLTALFAVGLGLSPVHRPQRAARRVAYGADRRAARGRG